MNRFSLFFALLGALLRAAPAAAYDLPAPPGSDRVYFEADKADYDKGKDSIHLQGHALVLEYGVNPSSGPLKVTKGEDIRVFPSSHVFVSSGAVLMEDSGGALFGYDAVYDWGAQKGTIKNVNADYSPWRVLKAKSVRRKPGGTYVFKSGRVTSCDYEDEHYSFSFSRMHFTPGDRLWGLNAIMYLGKIPVMYLPFIYRPLGNDAAYVTYLEPGYNKRNGLFMKTTIYHRYSKLITSRLFLDYYSKVGVGTGLELGWDNSKNFNGSVAGYRIRDGGVERWGLYGGYWKRFGGDDSQACPTCSQTVYSSQGQMRVVSDPYFNNDYFQDNPYAVSPNREISGAVVRQSKKTTTRISALNRSELLSGRNNFVTTYESMPRLDFSAPSIALPGLKGVVNSFTAYYNRAAYTDYTYYQESAYAQWMMSRAIPLGRRFSLLPSLSYDQTLTVHPHNSDGTIGQNQWVGAYGTSMVLRYDTLLGTLDTGYYYQRRFSPNSLNVDSAAADSGISTNTVTMQLFMRPNRYFYLRSGSGYDFKYTQNQSLDFDQRLLPVINELQYTPNDKLNMFVRNYYRVGDGSQAFVFQSGIGGPEETGGALGFSNYKSYGTTVADTISDFKTGPGAYIISPSVRWVPPNKTWRIDVGVSLYAYTTGGLNFNKLCMYEKNITLYKNFHDFFTQWYVKIRPGVETLGFMANLRFNDPTPRRASPEELQRFGNGWEYGGSSRP